jgi:glycosyltransferase involved in cell wall biosynthesis
MASNRYSGAEIVLRNLILKNMPEVIPIVFCGEGELATSFLNHKVETILTKNMPELGTKRVEGIRLITNIYLIIKNIFLYNRQLNFIIRNYKIDIVHVNSFIPSIYALPTVIIRYVLFLHKSPKFIWHHHDCSYAFNVTLNKLAYRLNLLAYDLVIVPSNATKLFLRAKQNKIKVLYNGVTIDKYNSDNYVGTLDTFSIGIFGQITEEKGHILLIYALSKLRNKYKFKLYIAGNFESQTIENKIKDLVNTYNLATNIIFLGFLQDMEYAYSKVDIVVNATSLKRSEPLGTTIIEAMAREKILIVSKTGGSPEIVTDSIDGFIFNPSVFVGC